MGAPAAAPAGRRGAPGPGEADAARRWHRVASTHSFEELQELHLEASPASLALAGVFLLGLGLVFFPAVLYGAVLSKPLPEAPPDAWLRRAVRDDHYYCLLVPLSIGMFIPKTVVQWVCAKLYKHAYL